MNLLKNFLYRILNKKKDGKFFFEAGIFFLVSIPNLSGLFFLVSLFFSFFKKRTSYFKCIWNKIFLTASILLLISSIIHNNPLNFTNNGAFINNNSFIGLFNWIPYFLCFWLFQPYLKSSKDRKKISDIFLFGSFPFLVSCIGQYFFNWYGPMQLFNGFIIWFQRPIDFEYDAGLTGLFNNANYAGSWLLFMWPICLANLYELKQSKKIKAFIAILSSIILLLLFFTKSKNAWLGTVLTIPFISKSENIKLFIPILLVIILLVSIVSFPIFPDSLKKLASFIVPDQISRNTQFGSFAAFLENPRIQIFEFALKLIKEKPFFGWGSATFPFLFEAENKSLWFWHSHNIYIEIAQSYGLICAFAIFLPILIILFKSFKKIFLNLKNNDCLKTNSFEKAWWTATFTFLLSQLFDIQYFDFRISMTFWIFLSGLTSLLKDKNYKFNK